MTDTADISFDYFNTLMSNNMPSEYKDILKSFQEQGNFYQQLLKSVNNNDDVSSFWDLPSTLGFSTNSHDQPDWLASMFNINTPPNDGKPLNVELFSNLFSQVPQQTQEHIKKIQSMMSNISALHNELGELASERFQTLQKEVENPSDEQVCAHWLKAGEDAFNAISQRDDYIQTQQTLMESLGELKNIQQTASEQLSVLLGLPSQESLRDLQKGLHQIRTEFAEYKEQTDRIINELNANVRQLT